MMLSPMIESELCASGSTPGEHSRISSFYDDDGRLETFKLRSNPRSPAKVILAGLERAAGTLKAEVVHGSTVATNALLERKGARTAFVTTAGFEDLIEIGRQNRAELYNLTPAPRRLLVDRDLCFGVEERAYFDGTIAEKPSAASGNAWRRGSKNRGAQVRRHLFSARVSELRERARRGEGAGEAWRLSLHVARSQSRISRVRARLNHVDQRLCRTADGQLSGPSWNARRRGVASRSCNRTADFFRPARRAKHAVRTVLSGPAGGVVGALETARLSGFTRVLGFDMGGTSTDVSLVDGEPRETTEAIGRRVSRSACRCWIFTRWARAADRSRAWTPAACCASDRRARARIRVRLVTERARRRPSPMRTWCWAASLREQLLGGAMTIDVERAAAAVDRIARALKIDRIVGRGRNFARRQRQYGAGDSRRLGRARPRSSRFRAGRIRRMRRTACLRNRARSWAFARSLFPNMPALYPRWAC